MKAVDPLLKVAEEPNKFHLAEPDHHTNSDVLGKRHRDSSQTSGEEGYDSINSDEELQAGEEATHNGHDASLSLSVISSSRVFGALDQDGLSLSRNLSVNGDSEDSGVNRDGPASLASSSGSSCGPPAFQELKVTSELGSTASPKRATFTIGTPKQLSAESHEGSDSPVTSPCISPTTGPDPVGEKTPISDDDQNEGIRNSGWDRAVTEAKEQAFARLQEELQSAHQELRLKDEEVSRLSRIRDQVEAELEDLTASLFQEAHNMVREANSRQAAAERSLAEARMQVEVLTAEVAALKTLVLTSTPARPNPHLHPQIDKTRSCDDTVGGGLFRKHRRSPSHFNLKYGRENSPPDSPTKEPICLNASSQSQSDSAANPAQSEHVEAKDGLQVDPNVHRDFLTWRQNPTISKTDPFVARVYREDIDLCLDFSNRELAERVEHAVEAGNIFIEAVGERTKTAFPKKCALLDAPRQCHYRMKLGDQDIWYCISQICRNRITAVIDFLNYLRYVERGLVKSSVHDIYWEIARLRKEMCLARLGLALDIQ